MTFFSYFMLDEQIFLSLIIYQRVITINKATDNLYSAIQS